jgi:hypothetical protein
MIDECRTGRRSAKNVVEHSVGSRLDDVCRAAMADEESFGEYIVALHAYCRIAI